jgi:hypothetical protein
MINQLKDQPFVQMVLGMVISFSMVIALLFIFAGGAA